MHNICYVEGISLTKGIYSFDNWEAYINQSRCFAVFSAVVTFVHLGWCPTNAGDGREVGLTWWTRHATVTVLMRLSIFETSLKCIGFREVEKWDDVVQ